MTTSTNTSQLNNTANEFDEPTRRVELKKKPAAAGARSTPAAADAAQTAAPKGWDVVETAHADASEAGLETKRVPMSLVSLGQNVRKVVDQKSVDDLAVSIKEVGLIQPPVARALPDGTFSIVVGQRRFLAMQKLQSEDPSRFDTIDLIVGTGSDSDLVQLAENLARAEMAPYDVCLALMRKSEEGLSASVISEKLGVSISLVRRYLRIGRAPEYVRSLLLRIEASTRVIDERGEPVLDKHGRQELKLQTLPALDVTKVEVLAQLAETLIQTDRRHARAPGYKPVAEVSVQRLARRCALENWSAATLTARCQEAERGRQVQEASAETGAEASAENERKAANPLAFNRKRLVIDTSVAHELTGDKRSSFIDDLNAVLGSLRLKVIESP